MIVQEPLLGFAAVFGLALAVAVLAWPALATLTVVFLIYTNAAAVAVKYHELPYSTGIVIPVLLVVPVAFYLYRRRPIVADAPVLAIVLFLVVQLVSTLLADDKGYALGQMSPFLVEGVAIYLLVRNAVRTVDVLRVVVWTLLVAGVLMAAVVIFQEITATYSKPYMGFGQVGHDWLTGRSKNPRLSGPIGDPNYFAQILLVLVPLGLLRFFGERTMFLRLLAAGATGVIAFALTLTFSRGAGVAFAVVLVMMTMLRYIRLYQLMMIAVGIVLLLNFVPEYKERVATLGRLTGGGSAAASSGADQSVRSRATEMKAAAAVFLDHPLVGVGPGSFPLYYQEYARRVGLEVHEAAQSGSRRGEEARRESHNIFLSIAADLGILGLTSFLAIVFLTFRRLNRARKRWLVAHPEAANLATSFMLALVAYLTSGLFLTLAFERYFWLLIALAGSAATLDLGRTEAPESARDREEAGPARRPFARRERTAAPLRRPPVRRRPSRPVRRPERAPADVPIPELPPPPVEVVPPAPERVEVVPPAPEPVEVVPPAPPPVEAEPPVPPPVEATPPAVPVEAAPPAPEPETVEVPFPPPLAPATVVIDVTFEESETGVTKLVEVPLVTRCAACRGTGAADEESCSECEGIGRKVAWTTVDVEVPAYVDDGMRIPLPGGPDGPGGYALLCVEGDPNDRIIRYVALTELAGAIGFLGYLYFLA